MNLFRHQLKHEVRRQLELLLLLAALAVLDLVLNLGWLDAALRGGVAQGPDLVSSLARMLPKVLIFLLGGFAIQVSLVDAPMQQDGFLSTRPMPKRDLFKAKAVLILSVVVVVPVLLEVVHLGLRGVGVMNVIHGVCERALVMVPAAVIVMGATSLWPDRRTMAWTFIALVGVVVVTGAMAWIGLGRVSNLLGASAGVGDITQSGALHAFAAAWLVSAGLAWIAWMSFKQRWSPARTWGYLAIVVLAGNLAVAALPASNLSPIGAEKVKVEEIAKGVAFGRGPGAVRLSVFQ